MGGGGETDDDGGHHGSLFALGTQLDVWLTAGCFLILSILTGILEAVIAYVDNKVVDLEHYQAMVHKVYKELMVLGVVSFGIFLTQQAEVWPSDWLLAFEFAHLVLFFSGIGYVMQALIYSQVLKHSREADIAMDNMEPKTLFANLKEKQSVSFFHFWFTPLFTEVRYYLCKHIFVNQNQLPKDLRFQEYVHQVMLTQIRDVLEVELSTYFLLVIFLGFNTALLFAMDSDGDGVIDGSDSTLTPGLMMFILAGFSLLLIDCFVYYSCNTASLAVMALFCLGDRPFTMITLTDAIGKALYRDADHVGRGQLREAGVVPRRSRTDRRSEKRRRSKSLEEVVDTSRSRARRKSREIALRDPCPAPQQDEDAENPMAAFDDNVVPLLPVPAPVDSPDDRSLERTKGSMSEAMLSLVQEISNSAATSARQDTSPSRTRESSKSPSVDPNRGLASNLLHRDDEAPIIPEREQLLARARANAAMVRAQLANVPRRGNTIRGSELPDRSSVQSTAEQTVSTDASPTEVFATDSFQRRTLSFQYTRAQAQMSTNEVDTMVERGRHRNASRKRVQGPMSRQRIHSQASAGASSRRRVVPFIRDQIRRAAGSELPQSSRSMSRTVNRPVSAPAASGAGGGASREEESQNGNNRRGVSVPGSRLSAPGSAKWFSRRNQGESAASLSQRRRTTNGVYGRHERPASSFNNTLNSERMSMESVGDGLGFQAIEIGKAFPCNSQRFTKRCLDISMLGKCLYFGLFACYFAAEAYKSNNPWLIFFAIMVPPSFAVFVVGPAAFRVFSLLTAISHVDVPVLSDVIHHMMMDVKNLRTELAKFVSHQIADDNREAGLQRIFKMFDTSGNGVLTPGEMYIGLGKLGLYHTRSEVRALLGLFKDQGGMNLEGFRKLVFPTEKHWSVWSGLLAPDSTDDPPPKPFSVRASLTRLRSSVGALVTGSFDTRNSGSGRVAPLPPQPPPSRAAREVYALRTIESGQSHRSESQRSESQPPRREGFRYRMDSVEDDGGSIGETNLEKSLGL